VFPRLNSEVVRIYRRLLVYVRPYWFVLVPAVLATTLYAGLSGAVPFFMSLTIEDLLDVGTDGAGAIRIPILIAIVLGARGVVDFLTVYGLSWVGRSVIRDLRTQLFGHYLALPAAYYDQSVTGTLLSKLTYNTEQVAEATSNAILVLVRDCQQIIVQVGVMIIFSPPLTLIVCVIGPLVGILVAYMSSAFRRYSTRIQDSMGDVTSVTEQSLQGHRIVKIFEGQAAEQAQFDSINNKNFRLNLRLAATRALGDSLTQYIVVLGLAVIVFLVLSDWVTAPEFIGFITAMGMMLAPLKRVVNVNVALQRGIASAESLFATLDEPGEPDTGTLAIQRAIGDIEFRHVSFSYAAGNSSVLNDINMTVPAGQTLALVGRSGSGKSTLAALLPRFYDVSDGEILLDGNAIDRYRLQDLRRQLSFVSQDVVLFDDSIAANIAYGELEKHSRAEIEVAAEAAFVTEFAADLAEGLDTKVGERGLLLSGGQRQRVAIARALLKDAPVLILDEATSALDTESERRVQDALGRLMKGRTTLVIAHRLSTVESADRIVVMKDGRIVETGTHKELLEQGGYYCALYSMQFAD